MQRERGKKRDSSKKAKVRAVGKIGRKRAELSGLSCLVCLVLSGLSRAAGVGKRAANGKGKEGAEQQTGESTS